MRRPRDRARNSARLLFVFLLCLAIVWFGMFGWAFWYTTGRYL